MSISSSASHHPQSAVSAGPVGHRGLSDWRISWAACGMEAEAPYPSSPRGLCLPGVSCRSQGQDAVFAAPTAGAPPLPGSTEPPMLGIPSRQGTIGIPIPSRREPDTRQVTYVTETVTTPHRRREACRRRKCGLKWLEVPALCPSQRDLDLDQTFETSKERKQWRSKPLAEVWGPRRIDIKKRWHLIHT